MYTYVHNHDVVCMFTTNNLQYIFLSIYYCYKNLLALQVITVHRVRWQESTKDLT